MMRTLGLQEFPQILRGESGSTLNSHVNCAYKGLAIMHGIKTLELNSVQQCRRRYV